MVERFGLGVLGTRLIKIGKSLEQNSPARTTGWGRPPTQIKRKKCGLAAGAFPGRPRSTAGHLPVWRAALLE